MVVLLRVYFFIIFIVFNLSDGVATNPPPTPFKESNNKPTNERRNQQQKDNYCDSPDNKENLKRKRSLPIDSMSSEQETKPPKKKLSRERVKNKKSQTSSRDHSEPSRSSRNVFQDKKTTASKKPSSKSQNRSHRDQRQSGYSKKSTSRQQSNYFQKRQKTVRQQHSTGGRMAKRTRSHRDRSRQNDRHVKIDRQQVLYQKYKHCISSNARTEEDHGSRRYVKFFRYHAIGNARMWHDEKLGVIKDLRKFLEPYNRIKSRNFALGSVIFKKSGQPDLPLDIPYLFISGYIGEGRDAKNMSRHIHDKTGYGVQCFDGTFQNGHRLQKNLCTFGDQPTEDSHNDYVEDLYKLYKNRKANNGLSSWERGLYHYESLHICYPKKKGSSYAFTFRYVHTEPLIFNFLKNYEPFREEVQKNPDLCIIDIASRNDMCWRCGDTLKTNCELEILGSKTVVRFSGLCGYLDKMCTGKISQKTGKKREDHYHFEGSERSKPPPLRRVKRDFEGYKMGTGYETSQRLSPNIDPEGHYRPYISNITNDDLDAMEGNHD